MLRENKAARSRCTVVPTGLSHSSFTKLPAHSPFIYQVSVFVSPMQQHQTLQWKIATQKLLSHLNWPEEELAMTQAPIATITFSSEPLQRIELAPLSRSPLNKVEMYTQARVHRLAAAVALVEHGGPTGKASVRTAGRIYGIPKSTLHRYIQANRAVKSLRTRSGCSKRVSHSTYVVPPRKCGISFIVNQESSPAHCGFR